MIGRLFEDSLALLVEHPGRVALGVVLWIAVALGLGLLIGPGISDRDGRR